MIRPHFLKGKQQFSSSQCNENLHVAQARVHVERVIGRIKSYKILHDQVDMNIVSHLDEIMVIIAALVNMSNSVFGEDKF